MGLANLAKAPNLLSEGGRPGSGGKWFLCVGGDGGREGSWEDGTAISPASVTSWPAGALVSPLNPTHFCSAGLKQGQAHSKCLINGDS